MIYAAIRYASEFHCEIEDLVDLEGITEDLKQRPKRQFCFNEGVRFKHVMVKTTVGKYSSISVLDAIRVHAYRNGEAKAKSRWSGRFMGDLLFQSSCGEKVWARVWCARASVMDHFRGAWRGFFRNKTVQINRSRARTGNQFDCLLLESI